MNNLLGKWLWRFFDANEKGLWKEIFFGLGIGLANDTYYWKDRWILESSLQTQYQLLHDLACDQNITASNRLQTYNRFYLAFRRQITGCLENNSLNFLTLISTIVLQSSVDKLVWRWETNGFTVHYFYTWLSFKGIKLDL
jgi:hypothetical protein